MVEQISPLDFFRALRWLDGTPLLDHIEPYRQKIFKEVLFDLEPDGRPRINLSLKGRSKKNWKTVDLDLAGIYRLVAWRSPAGNQCYILANDEGQSSDNLELAKKLVAANPLLQDFVVVKQKVIERKDGNGFLEILPARDISGTHGKTFLFAGFDEIHGYRSWDLLEAMQLDPTRPDALMWITSFASIYHRPGVPLFDLMRMGRAGTDPRMFFSWYAADFTTDPDFEHCDPETRANPSRASFVPDYLAQQRSRLPAHMYRRLHLNLPGLPEGSAFQPEPVMDAVERGVSVRAPEPGVTYSAFVDMSGGSNDDAVLAIGYRDPEGRAVLARIVNQGPPPPFDPIKAVERFVEVLKEYRLAAVTGDRFAGQTFQAAFQERGITYRVSDKTTSRLYEGLEPALNSGRVVLLDVPEVEQQLLGLVWRGGKIDHAHGEHDDYANAVAGVVAGLVQRVHEPLMPSAGLYQEPGVPLPLEALEPWYRGDAAEREFIEDMLKS